VIQKVLGQSQLSTTRRYTRTPVEVTRPALTRLQSLFDSPQEKTEKTLVTNSVTNSSTRSKPN